jgi:hypothetical protein
LEWLALGLKPALCGIILYDQAQLVFHRAGPASFYWMPEIAAQLSILAAAQIHGTPSNVSVVIGGCGGGGGDVVK